MFECLESSSQWAKQRFKVLGSELERQSVIVTINTVGYGLFSVLKLKHAFFDGSGRNQFEYKH